MSVLHHSRHGGFLETRLNSRLSYLLYRHLKTVTEAVCWGKKKKRRKEQENGGSARPLDTSSFRNRVISLRGNTCRKKKKIQSWKCHFGLWHNLFPPESFAEKALKRLMTSLHLHPREVTVMKIAPGGDQDHLLAQWEWRIKPRVNCGGTLVIAARDQVRNPLRSRVIRRITSGVVSLGLCALLPAAWGFPDS